MSFFFVQRLKRGIQKNLHFFAPRSFCGAKRPRRKGKGRRRRRDERTRWYKRARRTRRRKQRGGTRLTLSSSSSCRTRLFEKKATELVKEPLSIETSASPSSIPPYNDELVRSILEEVKAHHREMLSLLRKLENAENNEKEKRSISAAMETHHFSILRNKKA